MLGDLAAAKTFYTEAACRPYYYSEISWQTNLANKLNLAIQRG